VARHLAVAPARKVRFSAAGDHGYRVVDGRLVTERDDEICAVGDLRRGFPHDLLNGLAAAATALEGGATLAGARAALVAFDGLPHRMALVAEAGGVRYIDDSKATTPHAATAAVQSFASVVLIAGGQNKGLDLGALGEVADHVRAVVAIGDAAPEVAAAFAGRRPVSVATSMDQAVALAAGLAERDDVVLLSPGCASFDWYGGMGERGDDFARAVREHIGGGR
jgi:UDP-N-acetylmuramoylalanine--D-glutamate ligase